MFKQMYALARQLLTLMQDVQKLKAKHKEFRQELRALIDIVRQLKYEQQRDRENATHEREKLWLRLEKLLKIRFSLGWLGRGPAPGYPMLASDRNGKSGRTSNGKSSHRSCGKYPTKTETPPRPGFLRPCGSHWRSCA